MRCIAGERKHTENEGERELTVYDKSGKMRDER